MKPESHRAYLELSSFGVEELSSAQAAQLLRTIDDCPECHGQWVLFYHTIESLSNVGELPVPQDKSHEMWLVCVHHAQEKPVPYAKTNGYADGLSSKNGAEESALH